MSIRFPISERTARPWGLLFTGALLVGCGPPVYRYPGPLGSLGRPPTATPLPVASAEDPDDTASPVEAEPERAPPEVGLEVATAALDFLGARSLVVDGRRYRYDCSGLVAAVHARVGVDLGGSSVNLRDQARQEGLYHRRKRPHVGDVAFFENTYDKNGNGRLDDGLTHVAVVVAVDEDDTVRMVHRGSRGIAELTMNLRSPRDRTDAGGKVLNSYLRAKRAGDPARTRYLAGELWVGFGAFWKLAAGDSRI